MIKFINSFWHSRLDPRSQVLKKFFPDEFVKSFQQYVARVALSNFTIACLIDYAEYLSKGPIFKPGFKPYSYLSNIDQYLSKELNWFIEWANSQEFKDTYDAYVEKLKTETEKLVIIEPIKAEPEPKEKKETARQRRYRIQKNRDYKAKDVIEKFGNKCALCGYEKPTMNEESELYSPSGYMYSFLQLHHILSIKAGGEDKEENLLCLCPNCHIKIHCGDIDKTREDLYLINRKILNKEK